MAGYEKSTFADFKERLSAGHYNSITGARRGIGKMNLSKDENERAQVLANKHFGASGSPEASKPKAAKKAAKSPKVKAAKAAKAVKAKASKAAKAPKAKEPKQPRQKRGRKAEPHAQLSPMADQTIRIGTIQQALKAMQDAKSLGAPTSEVAEGARKAQMALVGIVNELCPRGEMQPTAEDLRQAEALGKAAKAAGVNAGGNNANHEA